MDITTSTEYKAAVAAGIDVEHIIAEAKDSERYKKFTSPQTLISILKSALQRSLSSTAGQADGDPFDEVVMVFGGNDIWGSKAPIRFVALRSSKNAKETHKHLGDFVEVMTWDSNAFPVTPCKCRLQGTVVENTYNGITSYAIHPAQDGNRNVTGISDIKEVSLINCQKALQKKAITPVVADMDKFDNLEKKRIYVFRGRIQWVNGNALFKDGAKVGSLPLISLNQRQPPRKHVTLGLTLNSNNSGYSVTLEFPKQRAGEAKIFIPDFEEIVEDAFMSHGADAAGDTDIRAQCTAVREMMVDREILGVGFLKSASTSQSSDIMYVTLNTVFCMEVLEEVPEVSREKLTDEDLTPACVEMNKKKREEEQSKKMQDEKASKVEEQAEREDVFVERLMEFSRVNSSDPAFMTEEKVRKVCEIPDEIDDKIVYVIRKAASKRYAAEKKDE